MNVSVLFVCLGNICRSPTVEGVTRHVLAGSAASDRIIVDSAGTANYHIGKPPDRRAQRAATARGFDLSGLKARQVEPEDYRRFDLILAMDRDNLFELQACRPANASAALGLFLEYAGHPSEIEVPDPYYGGAEGFEQVLDLAFGAARLLVAKLAVN